LGRSFQRAPLRSIQRMPSKQGRDATRGRPLVYRGIDRRSDTIARQ
jgi:hypothetical protein